MIKSKSKINSKDILFPLITNTEHELRIFVDDLLTYEFGDWEHDHKLLRPELRIELLKRQKEEEIALGNSSTSLVHYLHLVELEEIITTHSNIFNAIFSFPIKHYLVTLNSLRIPEAHSRSFVLKDSQISLGIGMCKTIVSSINEWKKGKGNPVKGYYLDFSLFQEGRIDGISEKRLIEAAKKWLLNLEDESGKPSRIGIIKEFGQGKRLDIKGSHMTFVLDNKPVPSYGDFLRILIHAYTTNIKTLDHVVKIGERPYRLIIWLLKHKINVDRIHTNLTKDGKFISSSSGITKPDGSILVGRFDYPISCKQNRFRISIAQDGYQDAKSSIELFCENNNYEDGFFRAHELISPSKIISFLYGNISFQEFCDILNTSMTPIQKRLEPHNL